MKNLLSIIAFCFLYVVSVIVQINTWLYNHVTFHIEKTLYYINENFVWRTSPYGKNILLVSIVFFAVLFAVTFVLESFFYKNKK